MGRALWTDLYELNMAASYLRRGMDRPATFSLFVRKLPPSRGFLVAAGLEACLEYLESFRFSEEDLEYLEGTLGFDREAVEAFRDLRFEGDVWAVPEGRIMFAGEPLLEVTAPVAQGQLVETFLLNRITVETTLASKAARFRIAARETDVVDFSFRRTHGVEAAMAVARTSAMVGFLGTSNVEAARVYGLTAVGTMAHSYVEAFESEEEAFRAYAQDHPARITFLVDTYDTVQGVRRAARVIHDLGLTGQLGIRLDSGDLEELARQARAILDADGLNDVRIFASGGLDELDVDRLVRSGAPIDAFGVGTRLGVSADAPYLDTVYKLVAYGDRAVAKLSPGKATAPGAKQVFRAPGLVDVLAVRDEPAPEASAPLLSPVMRDGRRTRPPPTLAEARERFEADLAELPPEAAALVDPVPPAVRTSERLEELSRRTRARLGRPASPGSQDERDSNQSVTGQG
ncbi:MAG: nicotinate phosphoribosyltransferase [Actinomycetota bacterium]|nr:nicotinate phosphoribosyltransferase [Actinomycetota bacterium]